MFPSNLRHDCIMVVSQDKLVFTPLFTGLGHPVHYKAPDWCEAICLVCSSSHPVSPDGNSVEESGSDGIGRESLSLWTSRQSGVHRWLQPLTQINKSVEMEIYQMPVVAHSH